MRPEKFFDLMVRTMYEARKNKRYGKDSVAFEANWAALLRRMCNELSARDFRIRENYTFLVSIPKWREIFATSFEGRMADHILCDLLTPYIERELHPRTFNNRKGMGSTAAIDQVIEDICEVSEGYTKPCRVIKWDLKGFFPNAQCEYMVQCFCRIIDKYSQELSEAYHDEEMPNFLKWLAMVCVHCNPTKHCERRTPVQLWVNIERSKSLFTKEPGVGVPIGRMSSQSGMGLYINDEVRWLNDECGIRTTVFMDDGVMVVPEECHAYALSLFPELRRRLEAKGVKMNDKKFYDQPFQHGVEFLGSHIKPYRIILNDNTWARCMERLEQYNRMEREAKYVNLDKFISTVNSYSGQLKIRTSCRRAQRLKDKIAEEWWEWIEWDERNLSVRCREGHKMKERMRTKWRLA